MRAIFCFVLVFGAIVASADKLPRLKLPKGTEITIGDYHSDSDVFEHVINEEKEVGPNYVTSEALQTAIGLSGSKDDFIRKMRASKGSVYVLKKELPELWKSEVDARAKRIKAGQRTR
jgi:hypothetical protein